MVLDCGYLGQAAGLRDAAISADLPMSDIVPEEIDCAVALLLVIELGKWTAEDEHWD